MAGGDNFCLRLNGFEKHVKASWNKLQMKMDFCDVTLACEGKQIQAHKVIISSCSPVLRNILKLNQNQNPIIYLRRVKYVNLLNLLSFMYQGEVNVAQEDIASFLEVAEDLNVRGLSEGNRESCDSNMGKLLKSTYQNLVSSPKKGKNKDNKEMEESNYHHSVSTAIDFMEPLENFSDNGNDNYDYLMDAENQKIKGEAKPFDNSINKNNSNDGYIMEPENHKIKAEEENNGQNKNEQNVISTLAGNQYFCGKCQKQFSSRGNLGLHNKSFHEGVRYSCNKCNYKATQKASLQRHMEQSCKNLVSSSKKENNRDNTEIEESNNHHSFTTVIDFMERLENIIDNGNDNHDYLMEAENQKIKGEVNDFIEPFENLIDTNNSHDGDLMEPENHKIKDEGKNNGQNKNEQNIFSTLAGNQFFCGNCQKHFSNRGNLWQHNKSSHEGVRYSCNKCDYKATQKSGLKRHVEQTCKKRISVGPHNIENDRSDIN